MMDMESFSPANHARPSCWLAKSSVLMTFPVLLSILLAGCGGVKPVKYYESVDFGEAFANPEVRGTVAFEAISKKAASKTISDLPGKAQASLIEVFGADKALIKTLPAVLVKPLKNPSVPQSIDNSRVKFSRKLSVSLVDVDFKPGDRVFSALFRLEIPAEWEFTNWRGFEIKDRSTKVATVTNKLTRSTNVVIPFIQNLLSEIGETTTTLNRTSEDTTVRDLTFELIEAMPLLSKSKASIYLRAPFPQINLAGRYQLEVDIAYKENPERQEVLFFKVSESKAEKVSSRAIDYVNPKYASGLKAKTQTLETVVRTVDGGKNTLWEDDDEAKYSKMPGKICPNPVEILSAKELEATVVKIIWDQNGGQDLYFFSKKKHGQSSAAQSLVLVDGKEALDLLAWLEGKGGKTNFTFKAGDGDNWKFFRCDQNNPVSLVGLTAADLPYLKAIRVDLTSVPNNKPTELCVYTGGLK